LKYRHFQGRISNVFKVFYFQRAFFLTALEAGLLARQMSSEGIRRCDAPVSMYYAAIDRCKHARNI
jgi:hypothetical protein